MKQTQAEMINQKNQLMNERLATEIGRLFLQNIQIQTEYEVLKNENVCLKDELDNNKYVGE